MKINWKKIATLAAQSMLVIGFSLLIAWKDGGSLKMIVGIISLGIGTVILLWPVINERRKSAEQPIQDPGKK